jgi:hypothetical protein
MEIIRFIPGVIAGLYLIGALASPVRGDPATPAVWKPQHMLFTYMGVTARYTCDGLRDKVRALLLDLGVRRDLKVQAIGCDDVGTNLRRAAPMIPRLILDFHSAAPYDPAAKPAPPDDAVIEARYEPFKILADPFRNMGPGECELVEGFARQVLPKLVTRGVSQDIHCVPYQQSGGNYWVKGEILKPVRHP